MNKLNSIISITGLTLLLACQSDDSIQQQTQLDYPETKKVDTVDHYFGTEVPAPYRWLENLDSEAVADWVKRQNKVSFGYLEQIPYRDKIKKRLKEIWNYPKHSPPFREGDHYFFYKNSGLQDQSVLYKTKGLDAEKEVFLDPNKMSEGGTVALKNVEADKKGKYMAYSISRAGSDWEEIYVKRISDQKKLGDHIEWVKFSGISWYKDGFYYSRYDKPKSGKKLSKKNKHHKVYYHKLGTSQNEDRLVYKDDQHPLRNFYTATTEDERFLLLYSSESTSGNALKVKDLTQPDSNFITIVDNFEHDNYVIDNLNGKLLIRTNNDAPRYRMVLVDPQQPDPSHWETFIPEKEDVLRSATRAGNKIITRYMKDASHRLHVYNLEGEYEKQVELPTLGRVSSLHGKKDDSLAFYSFTSFTYPSTIFKYNIKTGQSTVYRKPKIDFNTDAYKTKQVFYKSKDGTEVPMFIVHKKGLKKDGKNPTFLYGYGGFNISILPRFSISRLILLENGGIYASANLRGGGEYGEKWHKAGMRLKKQNVFDDFIHAAKYLIDENYTSTERLAIHGRSNGGLLVGATMTQKPGLFGVAFPAVGVMDMLRYHKFTIGWAWAEEYGSSEDSVQFENLYTYSPLHNVTDTCYPATMVTTADHDDRVVPAHSFKFISELQDHQTCSDPVVIRIETKAGHGAGTPTSKEIEQAADMWSFMFYNMDVEPKY